MTFMDNLNETFGVMPPNLIRRITVALISVILVLVIDVSILLGRSIGLVESIPFLNEQVTSVIIVSSLLFSLSLIYYVIFPGKRGKAEVYR